MWIGELLNKRISNILSILITRKLNHHFLSNYGEIFWIFNKASFVIQIWVTFERRSAGVDDVYFKIVYWNFPKVIKKCFFSFWLCRILSIEWLSFFFLCRLTRGRAKRVDKLLTLKLTRKVTNSHDLINVGLERNRMICISKKKKKVCSDFHFTRSAIYCIRSSHFLLTSAWFHYGLQNCVL